MNIERRFCFLNGCLYIRSSGICAASDLHIGLEDELRRQGLAFPLKEEQMLSARLEEVLDAFNPSVFVLAGDIFHSFNRMDKEVRDKFESLMSKLEEHCKVIMLRGSHDTMLSILRESPLERYDADGFTFAHGHDNIGDHGDLVLGHEHPVIQIEMERLPCFLFGEKVINGKDLLVLPAFNPLCQGVMINHVEGRDMLSPLLKAVNVDELSPIVEVQGEVLAFPRLRGLRRHID
jgi:putative SbcD/Mre11-related phosphoesterase